ncbi:MAG TPA: penicillin-binding protein 1C [Saprospiraceae bacterium]|nr:penicillin-binding protein 1C [Saprospiraceae bacterium]
MLKGLRIKRTLVIGLVILVAGLALGLWTIPFPSQGFSLALFSADGRLLGARLSDDQQWRFNPGNALPEKYIQCLLTYEDRYFYRHPGINPVSLIKALERNLRAGKVVSGGSTLTMQDIRMRRGPRSRNLWNKSLEMFWAISLELKWSKKKILEDYASRAPFGSNVVGLEAACWRYFDKSPNQLSWAEAACLAVLPNNPSMIHPGRNRSSLQSKRDRLLESLLRIRILDSLTYRLALMEPVPMAPRPLPDLAPHALDYLAKRGPSNPRLTTTLDYSIQQMAREIAKWGHDRLSAQYIQNIALLIAETRTGKVLAYCGNAPNTALSPFVDHIQAPRSTGSILKPFLFASALYQGTLLPGTLMDDIPVVIDGFQPQNFSGHYTGMIPMDQALIRSLNIPFVHLLKAYGLESFHTKLRQLGQRHILRPPSHYGLSLILGGAESSLWDLSGAYASMARVLQHYHEADRRYFSEDIHPLRLLEVENEEPRSTGVKDPVLLSAASIYQTLEVLKTLNRPDESGQWASFKQSRDIAWKTGTSYGFRDAWAIGLDPDYTVGVWVGNADGEGRPGLLGIKAAAPLLFDLFSRLPRSGQSWFEPPLDELTPVTVCRSSGMKATGICPATDTLLMDRHHDLTPLCNLHTSIWINPVTRLRVNQQCSQAGAMVSRVIFSMPPVQSFYFSRNHPDYESAPAWDPVCMGNQGKKMKMIFPQDQTSIFIPIDRDGKPGEVIFKLAHLQKDATVYWHLDDRYLGYTRDFHEYALHALPGPHRLTLIDDTGFELLHEFEVLAKEQR